MTTAGAVTGTVDGHEAPIAGTWKIDPGHALVGFASRHFMLTKVCGRFTKVEGSVRHREIPHGRVNREDWNLTWNMPLANGGMLVLKEIELEI